MPGFRSVPIAWRLLTYDPWRLCLSLLGIGFAVLLMFTEAGFLHGVYDSQCLLLEQFDADLVLMHALKEDVLPMQPFPRHRLVALLADPDVASVASLYQRHLGTWRAIGVKEDQLWALGFEPSERPLKIPELAGDSAQLDQENILLSDAKSRSFIKGLEPGALAEFNKRRATVVDRFSLGPDFRIDARVITSVNNLSRYFPATGPGPVDRERVEFGLVRLVPGANPQAVANRITSQLLPPDVKIMTVSQFTDQVRDHWARAQPIGVVFKIGMFVGFIIGISICYQILFTEINDKEREFAALKAIGYTNRALAGIVLREAVFLSLLSFGPGLLGYLLLARTFESFTGIVMRINLLRALQVLVATVLMCLGAALIAIRKVAGSDPAEVF